MSTSQKSPSSNSPKSPWGSAGENEKSKKYDRQLRLWGDEGQQKIEHARVCVINADILGCEVLKSLVLPGIGSFTLIDANKVCNEDSCNFFVGREDLGSNRAKVCCANLKQLNPDVRGDYLEEQIEEVLDNNPSFLSHFSVIIASNIWNENTLIRLSKLMWSLNIPLIVCFSLGFGGSVRLQVKEHPVIESHPDYVLEDLRLDDPFPELKEFLERNSKFETMTKDQICHTPYVAIIYRCLKEWRGKVSGSVYHIGNYMLPRETEHKRLLKNIILETKEKIRERLQKENEHNDISLENFDEAVKAMNQVLVYSHNIAKESYLVIYDKKGANLRFLPENRKMTWRGQFWLLVKALREYLDITSRQPPLSGSIPDMICDTDRYIELQKIYSKKSQENRETFASILRDLCVQYGRSTESISEKTIKTFCQCCRYSLRLVRTDPIFFEFEPKKDDPNQRKIKDYIDRTAMDGDLETSDLILYLMLRSVSRFMTEYNRFPGSYQAESDVSALKKIFKTILTEYGCEEQSKDDFVHEMCRYGGSELHSVSSFLGGVVAQEVIKLITCQYIPLDNLLVYNAITSVTSAHKW